jgi:hypothetical protein
MSDTGVDLSAIRGDWDFHARYVTNALDQTLKRVAKSWRALKAKAPAAGQVPVDDALMEEFIEACRQTRALTDDILLLQENRPAPAKSKRKRKVARRPKTRRPA